MTVQLSVDVRNDMLDAYETRIGTAPLLQLRTGPAPADCLAVDSGTLIAEIDAPLDWAAAAAAGEKDIQGLWQAAAIADGTIAHYRIKDSAGTQCHEQGAVFRGVTLTTSAATAIDGNVLTFADTTGIAVGMAVTGAGVPVQSYVVAVDATTVTLSQTAVAGVANATVVDFGGDITLDNPSVLAPQKITITSKILVAPGA